MEVRRNVKRVADPRGRLRPWLQTGGSIELRSRMKGRANLAYALMPIAILAMLAFAPRAWSAGPTSEQAPAAALQQLLDVNARYVADKEARPAARPSDAAQHPLAVILSCSDSRVPPEILFDQGVGALF